jgi:hypothetical protein
MLSDSPPSAMLVLHRSEDELHWEGSSTSGIIFVETIVSMIAVIDTLSITSFLDCWIK